jgi:hypothetical protein
MEGVNVGINLYFSDVAFAVELLICSLMLVRNRRGFPRDAVPALVLVITFVLSFLRGIGTYGFKEAGVSARGELFFILPVFAIMLLPRTSWLDAERLGRWLAWCGAFLSVVALLRWGHVLPDPSVLEGDLRDVSRSLNANYALVVGQGFIASTYFWIIRRDNPWWGVSSIGLGAVTVVLQHRSVWAAIALAVAWLTLRTFRQAAGRWIALGTIGIVALSVFVLTSPAGFRAVTGLLASDVEEAQSENSTWAWRVAGYQEATNGLLTMDKTDILLGQAAGWEDNTIGGTVASTHIHSEYVATLAGYGMVGAAALLIWLGVLAKRVGFPNSLLRMGTEGKQIGIPLIEALFVSEVVYFVAYSGGQLQGALLGLIWVVAIQRNEDTSGDCLADGSLLSGSREGQEA